MRRIGADEKGAGIAASGVSHHLEVEIQPETDSAPGSKVKALPPCSAADVERRKKVRPGDEIGDFFLDTPEEALKDAIIQSTLEIPAIIGFLIGHALTLAQKYHSQNCPVKGVAEPTCKKNSKIITY